MSVIYCDSFLDITGCGVLKAVLLKFQVFRDLRLCRCVNGYRCVVGIRIVMLSSSVSPSESSNPKAVFL